MKYAVRSTIIIVSDDPAEVATKVVALAGYAVQADGIEAHDITIDQVLAFTEQPVTDITSDIVNAVTAALSPPPANVIDIATKRRDPQS